MPLPVYENETGSYRAAQSLAKWIAYCDYVVSNKVGRAQIVTSVPGDPWQAINCPEIAWPGRHRAVPVEWFLVVYRRLGFPCHQFLHA
jgi:hypothetical protein